MTAKQEQPRRSKWQRILDRQGRARRELMRRAELRDGIDRAVDLIQKVRDQK